MWSIRHFASGEVPDFFLQTPVLLFFEVYLGPNILDCFTLGLNTVILNDFFLCKSSSTNFNFSSEASNLDEDSESEDTLLSGSHWTKFWIYCFIFRGCLSWDPWSFVSRFFNWYLGCFESEGLPLKVSAAVVNSESRVRELTKTAFLRMSLAVLRMVLLFCRCERSFMCSMHLSLPWNTYLNMFCQLIFVFSSCSCVSTWYIYSTNYFRCCAVVCWLVRDSDI